MKQFSFSLLMTILITNNLFAQVFEIKNKLSDFDLVENSKVETVQVYRKYTNDKDFTHYITYEFNKKGLLTCIETHN